MIFRNFDRTGPNDHVEEAGTQSRFKFEDFELARDSRLTT